VIPFFAPDAIYKPGDGRTFRGHDQIREAMTPQFTGAYGKMRFDEYDRLYDVDNRKAALRWICRHDITGRKGVRVNIFLRLRTLIGLGAMLGWEGMDCFHFNAEGKITGKYTYASYRRPLLRAELGRELG
jgi:hypothetical protein